MGSDDAANQEDPEVLRADIALVEAALARLARPLEQDTWSARAAFELQLMTTVVGQYLDDYGDDRPAMAPTAPALGGHDRTAISLVSADSGDDRVGYVAGEAEFVTFQTPEPLLGQTTFYCSHYFLNGTLDDPEEWAYRCGLYRWQADVVASILRGDVVVRTLGRVRRRTDVVVRTRNHDAFTVSRGLLGIVRYG